MSASIADWVAQCLAAFKTVSSIRTEINGDQGPVIQAISNELSRFRLWAGNIGAHRRGRSSLDYRLRDASTLKSQVIRLLDNLQESLDDAAAILRGERTPWDQMSSDSDDSDEDSDGELDLDGLGFDTELSQLSSNVAETIDCLLKLSMSIRNPASHDRYMAWKRTDASHFNSVDISHVKDKFKNADEWLASRLGKAISRRRQYFKYRESHGHKLAQGLDIDSGQTEAGAKSTVASSLPLAMRESTADPNLDKLDEDDYSDAGLSQTSFAPTVADDGIRRIPSLPRQAEKGPFECPFCHMLISVTNTLQWKKHVYADLRPYICLYENCPTPDEEYGRRHEWMNHVLRKHWTSRNCPYSCGLTFPDAETLKKHVKDEHVDHLEELDIDSLAKTSETMTPTDRDMQCPLCKQTLGSIKLYQRHVGRHQTELALFALPAIDDEGEAGSEPSDDHVESDVSQRSENDHMVSYFQITKRSTLLIESMLERTNLATRRYQLKGSKLDSKQIWERIQDHPKVHSDDFDLDAFCSELSMKAKESGHGPIVGESDFDSVLQKYIKEDSSPNNKKRGTNPKDMDDAMGATTAPSDFATTSEARERHTLPNEPNRFQLSPDEILSKTKELASGLEFIHEPLREISQRENEILERFDESTGQKLLTGNSRAESNQVHGGLTPENILEHEFPAGVHPGARLESMRHGQVKDGEGTGSEEASMEGIQLTHRYNVDGKPSSESSPRGPQLPRDNVPTTIDALLEKERQEILDTLENRNTSPLEGKDNMGMAPEAEELEETLKLSQPAEPSLGASTPFFASIDADTPNDYIRPRLFQKQEGMESGISAQHGSGNYDASVSAKAEYIAASTNERRFLAEVLGHDITSDAASVPQFGLTGGVEDLLTTPRSMAEMEQDLEAEKYRRRLREQLLNSGVNEETADAIMNRKKAEEERRIKMELELKRLREEEDAANEKELREKAAKEAIDSYQQEEAERMAKEPKASDFGNDKRESRQRTEDTLLQIREELAWLRESNMATPPTDPRSSNTPGSGAGTRQDDNFFIGTSQLQEGELATEQHRRERHAEAMQQAEEIARLRFQAERKAAQERNVREEDATRKAKEARRVVLEEAMEQQNAMLPQETQEEALQSEVPVQLQNRERNFPMHSNLPLSADSLRKTARGVERATDDFTIRLSGGAILRVDGAEIDPQGNTFDIKEAKDKEPGPSGGHRGEQGDKHPREEDLEEDLEEDPEKRQLQREKERLSRRFERRSSQPPGHRVRYFENYDYKPRSRDL